jgi:hypothetical protein
LVLTILGGWECGVTCDKFNSSYQGKFHFGTFAADDFRNLLLLIKSGQGMTLFGETAPASYPEKVPVDWEPCGSNSAHVFLIQCDYGS